MRSIRHVITLVMTALVVAVVGRALPAVTAQSTVIAVGAQLAPALISATLDPKTQSVEVSLQNNGGELIVAYGLRVSIELNSGKVKQSGYFMDYVQTPVGAAHRGIAPGGRRTFNVSYAVADGSVPLLVTVAPVALVFDDNDAVGEESSVRRLFEQRETYRLAYEEAAELIEGLRSRQPGLRFNQLTDEVSKLTGKHIGPGTAALIVNEMTALNRVGSMEPFAAATAAVARNVDRAKTSLRRPRQ